MPPAPEGGHLAAAPVGGRLDPARRRLEKECETIVRKDYID